MLEIIWNGSQASQIVRFVGHAYQPCLLQVMCFLLMHTTGLVWVGKVVNKFNTCAAAAALTCVSQIDAEAVRGVCALESSSYCVFLPRTHAQGVK